MSMGKGPGQLLGPLQSSVAACCAGIREGAVCWLLSDRVAALSVPQAGAACGAYGAAQVMAVSESSLEPAEAWGSSRAVSLHCCSHQLSPGRLVRTQSEPSEYRGHAERQADATGDPRRLPTAVALLGLRTVSHGRKGRVSVGLVPGPGLHACVWSP